jgi:hypothetical protein
MALAGLTPVCAGQAFADPSPGVATLVAPGKIGSVFVPKEDLSDLIGVSIEKEMTGKRPSKEPDLGKDSVCTPLVVPGDGTFGKSFTAYRFQTDVDAATPQDVDYFIDQEVLLYQDEENTAKVFQDAFTESVSQQCNGRRVRFEGMREGIELDVQVAAITQSHATWTVETVYNDEPVGWICSNEAGVQSNALYHAAVCQFGNGGPTVAAIAGQMDSQAMGVRA